MPRIEDLIPLIVNPREDLSAEYKNWLDLTSNEHKATLAKAAIALANHGGGYIVIGFQEDGGNLRSVPRPEGGGAISQDSVNAAVRRYASPEFHCEVHGVIHPEYNYDHYIVVVPGNITEPVMSRRDCPGVIAQNSCYIRKPGPRSEVPSTPEEWRSLINRCLRSSRDDLLEAIRAIVSGRAQMENPPAGARDALDAFCSSAREKWSELVRELPAESAPRFPNGYYEIGIRLVGIDPAGGLPELNRFLQGARRVRHTGWSPFLELHRPEWQPYAHDQYLEAWVGRPSESGEMGGDSSNCDFWRASKDGMLYTCRGYIEDNIGEIAPGTVVDVTIPVWRLAEALLFAHRLGGEFDGAEAIAVWYEFNGLEGRRLTSIGNRRIMMDYHICRTRNSSGYGVVSFDRLEDNIVEFVHELLAPLYEKFNLFALPRALVEAEIERLRAGRF